MSFLHRFLVLAGLVFALPHAAQAQRTALVVLAGDQPDALARAEAFQSVLMDQRGFAHVDVRLDATPDEVPGLLGAFLGEPGDLEDMRLALVLSPQEDICSGMEMASVRAGAPALVMAPECLVDGLALPAEPVVYDVEASGLDASLSVEPWGGEVAKGDVAFLAVPGQGDVLSAEAEAWLMEILAGDGDVSAIGLLDVLRRGLSGDGSDFTPGLYASGEAVARHVFLPGWPGFGPRLPRRAITRVRGGNLFAWPALDAPQVAFLPARERVEVLRFDHSARLAYVRTDAGRYGWMPRRELANP